jgi:hypothetical protein
MPAIEQAANRFQKSLFAPTGFVTRREVKQPSGCDGKSLLWQVTIHSYSHLLHRASGKSIVGMYSCWDEIWASTVCKTRLPFHDVAVDMRRAISCPARGCVGTARGKRMSQRKPHLQMQISLDGIFIMIYVNCRCRLAGYISHK